MYNLKNYSNMETVPAPSARANNMNGVVIDDQFRRNISSTVSYLLHKNAGSWIMEEDIEEIAAKTIERIFDQLGTYNPSRNASFKTWANAVAHNFAIRASEKLQRDRRRFVRLSSLAGYDMEDGDDQNSGQCRKSYDFTKGACFSWASGILGIDPESGEADFSMMKEADEQASRKRLACLENFLSTGLNESEKQMLEMMKDGLSKAQMMEVTHKSGANIDTCRCRLRSKIRNFMKSIDYYGIE